MVRIIYKLADQEKCPEFNKKDMNQKMFENAYFGKPYKTSEDTVALYLGKDIGDYKYRLAVSILSNITNDLSYVILQCDEFGCSKSDIDIVSEWHEPIICKCEWENYYDYRIMMPNREGHVRVSFFQGETIISDLFVAEEHRHKGYASILLNEADKLLNGKVAIIYPLEEWQKEWYEKRGYVIGKEEELDRIAEDYSESLINSIYLSQYGIDDKDLPESLSSVEIGARQGFKAGYYYKAKEENGSN